LLLEQRSFSILKSDDQSSTETSQPLECFRKSRNLYLQITQAIKADSQTANGLLGKAIWNKLEYSASNALVMLLPLSELDWINALIKQ